MYNRNSWKLYNDMRDEVSDRFNLKRIEIDILAFLNNYPECDTASDIVNFRFLAKSNVSQALEWLEAKDYLVTSKDAIDKRKIHIKLTSQANRVISQIEKMQNDYIEKVLTGFNEEERNQIEQYIIKMNHNCINN